MPSVSRMIWTHLRTKKAPEYTKKQSARLTAPNFNTVYQTSTTNPDPSATPSPNSTPANTARRTSTSDSGKSTTTRILLSQRLGGQTAHPQAFAGLKVVDLTRVIAAPAVTRSLAELGASVMRVTAPHLPDATTWHADLNWGKWNCSLDLRQAADKEKLRVLVLEADVFVSGYRPGVLDKYGFGQEQIIEMC